MSAPCNHVTYVCHIDHDIPGHCQFCDGGLFACSVCWSFEGATTTECPGRPITPDELDEVYAGHLDYRDGEWVAFRSPHTPNGRFA